ncbi:MAG: DEAD/DEAH box helicase [Infirmifilum sp.]
MVNGGFGDLRLSFERRRGLSENEFRDFLAYARKIANFDPERKIWVVSPEKVARLDVGELKEVLGVLERLSTITSEEIDMIISSRELRGSGSAQSATLYLTNFLEMRGSKEILDKILRDSDLSKYFIPRNGRIYLETVVNLSEAAGLLEKKYGIKLFYAPDLLTVRVLREKSMLKLVFGFADKKLSKLLLDEGTISFNVEKPILGPEGEYQGSELVSRTYRVAHWSWSDKTLVAPVALIDKYLSKLQSLGFKVEMYIEEKPEISLPMTKNFSLLPHQEEAFNIWMKRKRGTIAIFTRGGKSFIALEAIYRMRKPSLILVTTQELMNTWLEYIEKYLGIPYHFVGLLGAGEQKIRDITVATYTSAVKYIDVIKDRFELVIFDEAHHVPASTFKNVALRVDSLYRLALSATPTRRDNNHTLLYELCGALLYTLSYEDLVRLKVVAPIEKFKAIFVESDQEKLPKLREVLNENGGAKTIIFTQYLKTAETVYEYLRANSYKVVMITGQTPSIKRELLFKDFLEGRANIIISTTVLDEGITVPDAEVAVIYEGSGEGRQMIQRIGRVLGYAPGKTAKVYEIVNITNPREKYAYLRRSWVRDLYTFKGLEKYVEAAKKGTLDEINASYQRRIDTF